MGITVALIVIAVIVVAFSLLWNNFRYKLPDSIVGPVDKVVNKTQQGEAAVCLECVIALFGQRGDTEAVSQLQGYFARIWAWTPPLAPAPTPAPVPTPAPAPTTGGAA